MRLSSRVQAVYTIECDDPHCRLPDKALQTPDYKQIEEFQQLHEADHSKRQFEAV